MLFYRTRLLIVTFCSLVLSSLAAPSPVSASNATLEKRVTHRGTGHWFSTDGGSDACGFVDLDTYAIVGVSLERFNTGNCNQWIKITANGVTAYGLMHDICPGCNADDLNLTPILFQRFAPLIVDVIDVTWNYEPFGFQPGPGQV